VNRDRQLSASDGCSSPSQVVKRSSTALLAAAFVGIVPSYISRSVAGSYDNEGVAIFALIFTFYFWVKAVKTGSMLWAIGCALAYFYMVAAWGGYVFIINIIPIYVVILIVSGRYSSRLYVAYSTFYVVGSLMAMQVPFVGFNVIKQAECLASHGAFAVLHCTWAPVGLCCYELVH
jgi:dolichyl-diphosphooligosaccharide---protein glycosyltransferase